MICHQDRILLSHDDARHIRLVPGATGYQLSKEGYHLFPMNTPIPLLVDNKEKPIGTAQIYSLLFSQYKTFASYQVITLDR